MIIWVCFALELLSGMEVDLFVPSCTQLQNRFCLSPFFVELAFGINLIAYCIGSIICSGISDIYGKKNTILWGCFIFIAGSILCAFSNSFYLLLLGRFIQGFGISFPCVLAYVIIVDYYSKEQQAQFLGYLHGGITIGMAIAPIIGSFLAHYYGWQSNFHFLTLFGFFALILSYYFLPFDSYRTKKSFDLTAYKPVLTCKTTIFSIFSINFAVQGFWVFTALSPILYVGYYKMDLPLFGFYQGALSASFAVFSILGGHIIQKMGEEKALIRSVQVLFLSGLLILNCILFDLSPFWITFSLCIHCASNAITVLLVWPKILNFKEEHKTQRSGFATATRLIITALCAQGISYIYQDVFMPIGIFIMLVSFFSYPLILKTYRDLNKASTI